MDFFKSEEEFVEFIKRFQIPHPYVREGIGEDTAILEFNGKIISITTDSYSEDIHFRRSYLTLREIAYRTVAGALSDLAACGAKPITVLISLLIPENFSKNEIEEFYSGISEVLNNFGISISGGDLIKIKGKFSFTITCIGEISDYPILRRGAKENDLVCITGDTGRVLASLEMLENNIKVEEKIRKKLIEKFKYPKPRIAEIIELKEKLRISSGIDISDGISKDANRLAKASGVKIILEEEKLPLLPELVSFAGLLNKEPIYYVTNSGEEYEVLFTVPESEASKLPEWVAIIGRAEKGEGLFIKDKEGNLRELKGGYDFFETSKYF
ncbi:MAG: thiamine-phosphate kinase [Candidatus Hydrothermales bacterium]